MGGAEIRVSEPVVAFRETVSGTSDHTVMSKSPNKHNRLYLQARAMEDGLAEAIDEGKVGPKDDPKLRAKLMSEDFGWDKDLTKKIWCFGPDTMGPNILVDVTKGVQVRARLCVEGVLRVFEGVCGVCVWGGGVLCLAVMCCAALCCAHRNTPLLSGLSLCLSLSTTSHSNSCASTKSGRTMSIKRSLRFTTRSIFRSGGRVACALSSSAQTPRRTCASQWGCATCCSTAFRSCRRCRCCASRRP